MTARSPLARLMGVLLCALLAAAAAAQAQPIGQPLPIDELGRSRSGDTVLASAHRGKLLVVTLWASWCGPCRKELPILEALQRTVGKERLAVVAVNQEDRDTFRNLMRNMPPEWTLTFTRDVEQRVAKAVGKKGIPHLIIVDPQGVVARVRVGYGEDSVQEIVDDVNELMLKHGLAKATEPKAQPATATPTPEPAVAPTTQPASATATPA